MASTKLQRTFSQAATSNKIGTFSFWMKRSSLTGEQVILASPYGGSGRSFIRLENTSGQIYATINNASDAYIPNMLFRDLSAWYHIVLAIDLTQSTSTDRLKFYVNGNLITLYATQNPPSNAETISWGQNGILTDIGYDTRDNGGYLNALLSHVNWIDGTAYDATAFGETDAATGEWKIKTSPSVTYGTNGFFILKNGNSLTDQSGNNNNFTLASGTLTDTKDCPSNVFCTLNALSKNTYMNLYNGNTSSETNNGNEWATVSTTLGMNGGKYYCEAKVKNNSNKAVLGIYLASLDGGSQSALDSQRVGLNTGDGEIFVQGLWSYSPQTGLTTASNGDIYGIAFDSDNGSIQFYYNGSTYGSAVSNSVLQNETFMFAVQQLNTNFDWNFGNGYFATTAIATNSGNGYAGAEGASKFNYEPPTGHSALNTKGLNA